MRVLALTVLAASVLAAPAGAVTIAVGPNGHARVEAALPGLLPASWQHAPEAEALAARGGPFGDFAPLTGDGRATAIDAEGAAVRVYADAGGLHVQEAPPGGGYGPAVDLGDGAGTARLAVAASGAAAVAWTAGDQGHLALRTRFGQGWTTRALGTVQTLDGLVIDDEAVATALLTVTDDPLRPRWNAVAVVARPDGSGERRPVAYGERAVALLRHPAGDLVFLTAGAELRSNRLRADGTLELSRPAGAWSSDDQLAGAAVDGQDRLVVATTSPYSLYSRGLSVSEGTLEGGPASSRLLARGIAGARLAANDRGDAALVWAVAGLRPRLVVWRPGQPATAPMVLGSGRAYESPDAGVTAAGEVVAAFVDDDAVHQRVTAQRLPAGAQEIARVPAVRPRPRGLARCRAARPEATARTRWAVLHRRSRSRLVACSLETGHAIDLGAEVFKQSIALRGRLLAHAEFWYDDGPSSPAGVDLQVVDIRTGRLIGATGRILGEDAAVVDLVLAGDGAYAFVTCGVTDFYDADDKTRAARRACRRRSPRNAVVVNDGRESDVVSRGGRVDARSLRLRGRVVSWREDGRRRATRLAPLDR